MARRRLSGGAYNATIFIRGIGQNDFAIFSDPGAAMYLDGVYLGRSIGGIMDAVDLQRVESAARSAGHALRAQHHWRRCQHCLQAAHR